MEFSILNKKILNIIIMGGMFGLSSHYFFRLIMKLAMAIYACNCFQIDNVTYHGQVYCTNYIARFWGGGGWGQNPYLGWNRHKVIKSLSAYINCDELK